MKKEIILYMVFLAFLFGINGCNEVERESPSAEIVSNNPNDIISNPIQIIDDNVTNDENITENSESVASNLYRVVLKPSTNDLSSGRIEQISYEIKNIDTNITASNVVVTLIEFSVDDNYAKFISSDGHEASSISFSGDEAFAKGSMAIKSLGNSGSIKVKFVANILLRNGEINKLTDYLSMIIVGNVSSSMALIPAYPVTYDGEKGLYVERFVVHVVDKYGNKAQDGTQVSAGVISRVKKSLDDVTSLYGRADTSNFGIISRDENNISIFSLKGTTFDFARVDPDDTVIILADPGRSEPHYLGGWNVKEVLEDELSFWNSYTDSNSSVNNLSFAIGDDKRDNVCFGTLANADIYAPNGYEIKEGLVQLELRYDSYMVGKSVFIYANSTLDNKRIGISRRVDLEGTGVKSQSFTCDNSDNNLTTKFCSMSSYLILNDSDDRPRDMRFGSYVCESGPCGESMINLSSIGCKGSIDVSLSSPPSKVVTISVGDIIVPEFN